MCTNEVRYIQIDKRFSVGLSQNEIKVVFTYSIYTKYEKYCWKVIIYSLIMPYKSKHNPHRLARK